MTPRVLLIDNYDSFTYNLAQYLGALNAELKVVRNDAISRNEIEANLPSHIVISPGPGRPEDAGISAEVIRTFGPRSIPILGVCLGHQTIAQVFGGRVGASPVPIHGKVSAVHHDASGLYHGLTNPFSATRYHSLEVLSPIPEDLMVTARTEDGTIMGIRHRRFPIEGVQFHPESILTTVGKALLENFLLQKTVLVGEALR